jgi:hypothetical protein
MPVAALRVTSLEAVGAASPQEEERWSFLCSMKEMTFSGNQEIVNCPENELRKA